MKAKQEEVEKGDDADSTMLLESGAGMAGQWSTRARCLLVLGALLAYFLLLSYIKTQYLQVRRLNRLLAIEKNTDELLKKLQLMDHHLRVKLERLEALHHL